MVMIHNNEMITQLTVIPYLYFPKAGDADSRIAIDMTSHLQSPISFTDKVQISPVLYSFTKLYLSVFWQL